MDFSNQLCRLNCICMIMLRKSSRADSVQRNDFCSTWKSHALWPLWPKKSQKNVWLSKEFRCWPDPQWSIKRSHLLSWCFTFTETTRRIRDGEGGEWGGVGVGGVIGYLWAVRPRTPTRKDRRDRQPPPEQHWGPHQREAAFALRKQTISGNNRQR